MIPKNLNKNHKLDKVNTKLLADTNFKSSFAKEEKSPSRQQNSVEEKRSNFAPIKMAPRWKAPEARTGTPDSAEGANALGEWPGSGQPAKEIFFPKNC